MALIAGKGESSLNRLKPIRKKRSLPRIFREPPVLSTANKSFEVKRRSALLINPFYSKDPNSSFGKHVLTPTLALSSVAGSTPDDWEITIWDENLLQGHPPTDPFPEVVGITVHLTFAERAFELADWYRARGSIVVLGGLHVQACTEECRLHADSLVTGEGVQIWGDLLRDFEAGSLKTEYLGSFRRPYREEPPPRRELIDKRQYLTRTSMIASRGCHNRCNFCYLSTEGMHMPYQMLDVEQVIQQITTLSRRRK